MRLCDRAIALVKTTARQVENAHAVVLLPLRTRHDTHVINDYVTLYFGIHSLSVDLVGLVIYLLRM